MKRVILALFRFYQCALSPLNPGTCRFTPTCSNYAIEAVNRFGAFRGCYLALRRILRCNPLCRGGYDPVPEHMVWIKTRIT